MSFSASDISVAMLRGIGANDPRMLSFLENHKRERRATMSEDRIRGVLCGSVEIARYRSASEWLQANRDMHAPIWLGHEPETTVHERGNRRFVAFGAKANNKAMVFELHGRNFQRILRKS